MAIIYTYPPLTALQGSDLLLISDTSTSNSTKSVTLADIATFVTGTGGGVGTTNYVVQFTDGPAGLLGDSPAYTFDGGAGLKEFILDDGYRFVVNRSAATTVADPEFAVSQGGVTKTSFGWDDDGGGYGFLYNWAGDGFRFGSTALYPQLELITSPALKIVSSSDFEVTGTGDFTGQVTIPLTPVAVTDAASKGYVDTEIAGIPAGLIFQGNWDASVLPAGSPDLTNVALQVTGHYYVVTTAGSAEPNGPATTPDSWSVGDWVVFIEQGATDRWEKIDQTFVAGSGAINNVTIWDSVNTVTSTADDFYYNLISNRLGLGTSSPNFKMDIGGGDLRMEQNYGILFGGTGSNHQNFMIYTTGDPFGGSYPGTWSVGMGNRAGSLANPALTINRVNPGTDGQITFNTYGAGTFTGTATYDLSVDVNGNIIETTGGGAGGPFVPYMSGADQIARTEGAATYNTSLGFQALQALAAGGNYNTTMGGEAGTAITTGDQNVAIGYQALQTEDTGSRNVAIGAYALKDLNNNALSYNVGVGYAAGLQVMR